MTLNELQLRRMTMKAAMSMQHEGVLCIVAAIVGLDGKSSVDVAFNMEVMGLSEAEAKVERQRIGRGVLAALQRSLGEDEAEPEGGMVS